MFDRINPFLSVLALVCCLFVWQLPDPSRAQQTGQPQQVDNPSESRAASFQAVEGARVEDVSGGSLMLGAYGLIWLFVFAYLVRLSRLQAATEKEQQQLEQMLARVEGADRRAEDPSRQ